MKTLKSKPGPKPFVFVRKTISFAKEQHAFIDSAAQRDRKAFAALVREAVDGLIKRKGAER